jgi:hypothetical protein
MSEIKSDRDFTRGQKKWIKVQAAGFLIFLALALFFPLIASFATNEAGPALFWSVVFAVAVGFVIKLKMIEHAMHAVDVLMAPLD